MNNSSNIVDHPLAGKIVGSYVVHKLIGRGGMGDVYELLHPAIKKKMALKVLHERYVNNKSATRRFFEEARAVNLVKSPYVVDVIDFEYLDDGRPYIVMEYLEGSNLKDYFKKKPALPLSECQKLFEGLFSGLEQIHDSGIIHRDLKPSNIFLVDNDVSKPKILDFGIAKVEPSVQSANGITKSNIVLGSPNYMSPEQAQGLSAQVDKRSDIYSLGLILYRALSGLTPFSADTQAAMLLHHIQTPTPSLHSSRTALAKKWNALIQKATAKNKEERFGSIAEFREFFNACNNLKAVSGRKTALLTALIAVPLLVLLYSFLAPHPTDQSATKKINPSKPDPVTLVQRIEPPPNNPGTIPVEDKLSSSEEKRVKPKHKSVQYGHVLLKAKPWALVFVDGKKWGQTPIRKRISAGVHHLRFENKSNESSKRKKITVTKGKTTVIEMKMD